MNLPVRGLCQEVTFSGYKPNSAAWFASNFLSHKLRATRAQLGTPSLF